MSTTKRTASDQLLLDIFTTALEGGINYWSEVTSYHWSNTDGTDDYTGFYADIESPEGDFDPVRIDRAVIAKGYRLATTTCRHKLNWSVCIPPLVIGPDTDWDYDAGDADMIVQLGVFGEVVYG